jgi:hypothetical protein
VRAARRLGIRRMYDSIMANLSSLRVELSVLLALLMGAAGGACTTKACTDIGCQDGFTATLQRADGSFPSGTHQIDVLADGTSLSCRFAFPLETAPGGGTFQPSCPPGLTVTIWPATTCTQTTTGTAVSQTCQPIPGQFVETIAVSGTPTQVHVWQTVDGTSIVDAAASPSYQEARPNGPGCEPICRQATTSWQLD